MAIELKGNDTSTYSDDVTISGDLSAADGAFSGRVDVRSGVTVDGGSSISTGFYYRDDSGNNGLALYRSGPNAAARNIHLKTDGSATFKGGVEVQSTSGAKGLINGDGFYQYATDGSTATAQILNSGAATFHGNIVCGSASAVTISNTGTITAPGTYNTTAASPRSMFISSGGLMGGLSSVRASKKNINYEADYSWLADLKPVAFNYRKTAEGEPAVYTEETYDELYYGLIAEDVETVAPAICNYDSDNNLQGIEYTKLITPILSQLQSALKRIEALEAQLSTQGGEAS